MLEARGILFVVENNKLQVENKVSGIGYRIVLKAEGKYPDFVSISHDL